MKKAVVLMAVLMACGAVSVPAAGGDFGLGIIVGEPTGFSGKYYVSDRNAIDGALAWSLDDRNYMHVHGDYLFHNFFILEDVDGEFAWYLGVGGRIVLVDRDDARGEEGDDHVGVRFPLGITYLFDNGHFDTFLEMVPIMDVAPDTDFDLEGAIGVRYYF